MVITRIHDDVIKCKHFPVTGDFPALMFSLICAWMNDWVNNCEAGDLRHYRAHYDFTVMYTCGIFSGYSGAVSIPCNVMYEFRYTNLPPTDECLKQDIS